MLADYLNYFLPVLSEIKKSKTVVKINPKPILLVVNEFCVQKRCHVCMSIGKHKRFFFFLLELDDVTLETVVAQQILAVIRWSQQTCRKNKCKPEMKVAKRLLNCLSSFRYTRANLHFGVITWAIYIKWMYIKLSI